MPPSLLSTLGLDYTQPAESVSALSSTINTCATGAQASWSELGCQTSQRKRRAGRPAAVAAATSGSSSVGTSSAVEPISADFISTNSLLRTPLVWLRFVNSTARRARRLPIGLDLLDTLRTLLSAALECSTQLANLFLRPHSPLSLLEVLLPRPLSALEKLLRRDNALWPSQIRSSANHPHQHNSSLSSERSHSNKSGLGADAYTKACKENAKAFLYHLDSCLNQDQLFSSIYSTMLSGESEWTRRLRESNTAKSTEPNQSRIDVDMRRVRFTCPRCERSMRPELSTVLRCIESLRAFIDDKLKLVYSDIAPSSSLMMRFPEIIAACLLVQRAQTFVKNTRSVILSSNELRHAVAEYEAFSGSQIPLTDCQDDGSQQSESNAIAGNSETCGLINWPSGPAESTGCLKSQLPASERQNDQFSNVSLLSRQPPSHYNDRHHHQPLLTSQPLTASHRITSPVGPLVSSGLLETNSHNSNTNTCPSNLTAHVMSTSGQVMRGSSHFQLEHSQQQSAKRTQPVLVTSNMTPSSGLVSLAGHTGLLTSSDGLSGITSTGASSALSATTGSIVGAGHHKQGGVLMQLHVSSGTDQVSDFQDDICAVFQNVRSLVTGYYSTDYFHIVKNRYHNHLVSATDWSQPSACTLSVLADFVLCL
ncbi:unnamed protein product [Protopolystoma xenopodis]|uniref:Uncharacterized protein n=1 Tax=Protopolystoma xenopodis TaxID=117903 RepID=A0A448WA24_9PLAT|nr:unnamed protein product [Protopolystoma xenopodis]